MNNYSYVNIKFEVPHNASVPYQPIDLEAGLMSLGLPEIPNNTMDQEGFIRHETGPEILILATTLANLATVIIGLYSTWKKAHPDTRIHVTVESPDQLEQVLETLKKK